MEQHSSIPRCTPKRWGKGDPPLSLRSFRSVSSFFLVGPPKPCARSSKLQTRSRHRGDACPWGSPGGGRCQSLSRPFCCCRRYHSPWLTGSGLTSHCCFRGFLAGLHSFRHFGRHCPTTRGSYVQHKVQIINLFVLSSKHEDRQIV